jgi:hypothetical protein
MPRLLIVTMTLLLIVLPAAPAAAQDPDVIALATPPPASSLHAPAPGAGNLESPGAVDLYRFDATAGTVARLEALSGSTMLNTLRRCHSTVRGLR